MKYIYKDFLSARAIFFKSTRFDLIFKYLYLTNINKPSSLFFQKLYLESIRYFNNFYEQEPKKTCSSDFLQSFIDLNQSISIHGYNDAASPITLSSNLDLYDGAHRLSICAVNDLVIKPHITDSEAIYDYKYFLSKGMPLWMSDYAAYFFLTTSPFAYIANVHSSVPTNLDSQIEDIFKANMCRIFYKKSISLSFPGYINLKKITYEGEDWIGSPHNLFQGATSHAENSFGPYPLRAFVLIADTLDQIVRAKKEIRSLTGLGNPAIHTSDTYIDKARLGQSLLFENSIHMLNNLSIEHDFLRDYPELSVYRSAINTSGLDEDHFCVVGSFPLDLYGVRNARDIDYLSLSNSILEAPEYISPHEIEESFYLEGCIGQVLHPSMFFYFHSIKVISLTSLLFYKIKRNELPKDSLDVLSLFYFLSSAQTPSQPLNQISETRIQKSILVRFFLKLKHYVVTLFRIL